MPTISVNLGGTESVLKELAKATLQQKMLIAEQVNITAINIETKAKASLRTKGVDNGRLRSSIRIAVFDDAKTIARTVWTDVFYAPYIEFGTGIYAKKRDGRKTPWVYYYHGKKGKQGFRFTRGIRPIPFLYPAFNSEIKALAKRLKKALGQ